MTRVGWRKQELTIVGFTELVDIRASVEAKIVEVDVEGLAFIKSKKTLKKLSKLFGID